MLRKISPERKAIFAEECWSLIYELKGDLPQAIKHRENETRLIKRLHHLARDSPSRDFILNEYGYDDLSDRLDLLAVLYHDNGELDKAISTLQKSRELCKRHGVDFDGQDILQEYLDERRMFPNGYWRARHRHPGWTAGSRQQRRR